MFENRQGILIAGALVIAVGAVSLGVMGLQRAIVEPFATSGVSEETNAALANHPELAALKEQDTDADGLSDFDELYVHQTSPYLDDSDTDGLSDKIELDAGQNPNCPEGSTCPVSTTPSATTNTNELVETNTNSSVVNPSVEALSTDELRQALRDAGAPADELASIDDETLRQYYAQVLAEESAGTNANVSASTNTNTAISQSELEDLSAADIRQLLVAAGVDAEILATVDDATLLQIYAEAVAGINQ